MKTVVVQGGTDGMGRGIALSCLKRGDSVVVLGRSAEKGAALAETARELGARDRFLFLQADLALVGENERVLAEIEKRHDVVDALVLCARHYSSARQETAEGLERTFALFFVSRFLLCHGLADLLEKAEQPVVVNIAGPGGQLSWLTWDDLGLSRGYDGQRALLQCGVANDLLGVSFTQLRDGGRTRYVLVNPGMVATSFSGDYDAATAGHIDMMKRMGRPVAEAIVPILALLDSPPVEALSAFSAGRRMDLAAESTFDAGAARRLHALTEELLRRA